MSELYLQLDHYGGEDGTGPDFVMCGPWDFIEFESGGLTLSLTDRAGKQYYKEFITVGDSDTHMFRGVMFWNVYITSGTVEKALDARDKAIADGYELEVWTSAPGYTPREATQ